MDANKRFDTINFNNNKIRVHFVFCACVHRGLNKRACATIMKQQIFSKENLWGASNSQNPKQKDAVFLSATA